MRKLLLATLAAGALGLGLSAPASAQTHGGVNLDRAYPGEAYTQYYYGRRYYGRPYYGRRYYDGGAAAAGVIGGLAAGAIIGGAIAAQQQPQALPRTQDPDYIAYCSRKYRSFDPVDGTFLSTDGNRYVCQAPVPY